MSRARWIALVALAAAAVFAYWGGTFSEPNYRALRREESAASRQVVQLQREVDSLRIFRDSIATNPVVQERVAREHWGMLRPGELTFSILPADSSPRDSVRRKP